ncbi:MAG: hypothetical protein F4039_07570 [Gammaproteobacteria bacterium]|nr:hypothetical protein [Gammaproteobacteria bacterium]MYF54013.1 hypothetical protein [Gammaproteobacteria bacterium]MYK43928.1 hypothetical protein [Gammaproteobacteria bacterium]
MNNSKNASQFRPRLPSVLLGVGIAIIALVIVYFFIPLSEEHEQTKKTQPESSRELEDSRHLTQSSTDTTDSLQSQIDIEPLSLSVDLSDVQTFNDVLTNLSSTFERYFALYHIASQANESQLVKLINEVVDYNVDIETEYWIENALSIFLRRLVVLNPESATAYLDNVERYAWERLAYWFFNDWAKNDLDGVVNWVNKNELGDYTKKYQAVYGIMGAYSTLPTDELKDLANRLGDVGDMYMRSYYQEELYADELENPEGAWYELVADTSRLNHNNMNRIRTIVNAWIEKDGISVLDSIAETITDKNLEHTVLMNGLRMVARTEPNEALDYALALDAQVDYGSYARNVVSEWVYSDPMSALERVLNLDETYDRQSLAKTVFGTWAARNVEDLLGSLDEVPVEYHDIARGSAISTLSYQSIEKAVDLVGEIHSEEEKSQAARRVVRQWVRDDLEATLAWVMTNPAVESLRDQLLQQVLSSIADTDPDKAFEIALAQPLVGEGEEAVGLEAQVLVNIGSSNAEKALELLPKVRAGKTKTQAINVVGRSLAINGRIEEAIALGQDLPEEDKVQFYTTIGSSSLAMGMIGESSDFSVFDTIEKIPSDDARSRIALSVIAFNSFNKTLSDEEVEALKEYMSEEDLEELEESRDQFESLLMPFFGL